MTGGKAPGIAAAGDRADVPDDGRLRVDVRGADQQQPALLVALCDGGKHPLVQVLRDGLEERRGVGQRVIEDGRRDAAAAQHAVRRDGGADLLQRIVPVGAEIGEGGGQRAGGDTGHEVEGRSRPVCGPTVQEPRTECAVLAAAGDGKQVQFGNHRAIRQTKRKASPREGGHDLLVKPGLAVRRGNPVAFVRQPEDARFPRSGGRYRGKPRRDRAPRQEGRHPDPEGAMQKPASRCAR